VLASFCHPVGKNGFFRAEKTVPAKIVFDRQKLLFATIFIYLLLFWIISWQCILLHKFVTYLFADKELRRV